jgi:hypothetical protein
MNDGDLCLPAAACAGAEALAQRLLAIGDSIMTAAVAARRQPAAQLPLVGALLQLLALAAGGAPGGLSPATVAALLEGGYSMSGGLTTVVCCVRSLKQCQHVPAPTGVLLEGGVLTVNSTREWPANEGSLAGAFARAEACIWSVLNASATSSICQIGTHAPVTGAELTARRAMPLAAQSQPIAVFSAPAAHSADPSADQAAAVAPARALDALRAALESRLPQLLARHLALVDVLAADAMSNGAAGQVRVFLYSGTLRQRFAVKTCCIQQR